MDTITRAEPGPHSAPEGAGPPLWRASARARRRTEALLLLLVAVLTIGGHCAASLTMRGELPPQLAGFAGSVLLFLLVAHLAVRFAAPCADPLILPLASLLSGLGLVLLYRLDVAYAERYPKSTPTAPGQLLWLVIGVAVFAAVVLALRDHRHLRRYIYVTMVVALGLLMAPAFFSADVYGAKRWIFLGPLSVQPGEFVKIMISVFFAGYLATHRDGLALAGRKFLGMRLPPGRQFAPLVVIWVVSLLVLVFERDLGTSLIFFGVFVLMLYSATSRTSWIVCGLAMAVVGAAVVGSVQPHVKGRVEAWLNPMAIYLPVGQRPPGLVSDQSAQALFSFGSGGLAGTGLGGGNPELVGFAGRSDFILTTVGEELGLAGLMAVLLVYALLVQRGFSAGLRLSDPFGKLLAVGLAGALGLQVFVVAGGVTGLVPLTGKALPFLAKGGSSLVANWIMVALMVRLSDSAERGRVDRASSGGDPRDAP
ncbi:FtsW/RodA/SpoVE family cell cycle protein [Streptomyces sp. NPDC001941]|uniref:FtsW/RodA/SpoVE family cell cycle protein n=1 Tax=Streptomyces sp. NPDC001941 TaxID=3154659 RepID=UPI00332B6F8F